MSKTAATSCMALKNRTLLDRELNIFKEEAIKKAEKKDVMYFQRKIEVVSRSGHFQG